jgi:hypothetical protein
MDEIAQDYDYHQAAEPCEDYDYHQVEPKGRARTESSLSESTLASESDLHTREEEKPRNTPWRKLDKFASNHQLDQSQWTTLMIKNIPNRYGLEWLLMEIQATGLDCNFLHLPLIKRSHANVGYAFINFNTPLDARQFIEVFEGHQFARQPGSKKRAHVIYAKLQGFQENVKFFSSRRVAKTDRAPWVKQM